MEHIDGKGCLRLVSRIVFLVEATFNKRDFHRFGIETLQSNGFGVQVWDLTKVLNPGYAANHRVPDPYTFDGLRVLETNDDIRKAIVRLERNDVVVALLGFSSKYFFIYRSLSRRGIKYGVNSLVPLPGVAPKRNYLKFATKGFSSPGKLLGAVANRLPVSLLGIKPPSFILIAGTAANGSNYPIGKSTDVVNCHTPDYDRYLQMDKTLEARVGQHGVFLDEYLPFHPEFLIGDLKAPAPPETYYHKLNDFFGLVERETGCEVVIAAHPRSKYEDHPDYFDGRTVSRGSTPELIKDAKFVLAHCSTSIGFAVLFEKPVFFLTTNEIEKSYLSDHIAMMAKWFGKRPLNLDEYGELDIDREMTVDATAYNLYRQTFIKKHGTPEIPLWQIFANYLRNSSAA